MPKGRRVPGVFLRKRERRPAGHVLQKDSHVSKTNEPLAGEQTRNARKISLCCSSPNSLYVTAGKFTCSKCLRRGNGNSFLFPGPSLNQSFSLVPGETKGISPSMKRTMDVHRCFPSMQTNFSFISRRLLWEKINGGT